MASIYKRGSKWTANVFIIQDGQRKRKTKSGFSTKREAQAWSVDAEMKKKNNEFNVENVVFTEAFEEWYHIFKEPQLDAQKSINWTIFIQLLRQHLRYDCDYKN